MHDAIRDLPDPEEWVGTKHVAVDEHEYHLGYAEHDVISVVQVTDPQREVGVLVDADILSMTSIRRQPDGRWVANWSGISVNSPNWRDVVKQLTQLWT